MKRTVNRSAARSSSMRGVASAVEMYELYQKGVTLAEVGRTFGISESRVSQLFKKAGLKVRPGISRTPAIVKEMYQLYHDGATLKEVGIRFAISSTMVLKIFRDGGLPTRRRSGRRKVYSDAELLDCLKLAADALGGTPGRDEYNEYARARCFADGRRWPASSAAMSRFGSWTNALERSGIPIARKPAIRSSPVSRVVSVDEMYALYEQGVTLEAVGEAFGVSAAYVGRSFKKAGLKARPARTVANVDAMYQLYQQNATLAEVGVRFGISASRVGQIFRDAGLPTRPAPGRQRLYSDAELLDCLKLAADAMGGTLRRDKYQAFAHARCFADGRRWPASSAAMSRFGSWTNALKRAGIPKKVIAPKAGAPRYSDAELLDCLRSASRTLGGVVTVAAYDELGRGQHLDDGRPWPSSQTSIKRFGSWRKALEVAGVPYRRAARAKEKIYSDRELLDCLHSANQALGEKLTVSTYDELARSRSLPDGRAWPTHHTPMKRFGSWVNALETAGLSGKAQGGERVYSDDELLDCLRSAGQTLGEALTSSSYYEFARDRRFPDGRPWPTESAPKKRFGTWYKALEAAGVSPRTAAKEKTEGKTYSDAELSGCLRLAADALGGSLNQAEYSAYARSRTLAAGHGLPTHATLVDRFGSWTSALDAAGIPRKAAAQKYSDAELLDCLRSASQALGGVVAISAYDELGRGQRLDDGRPWPSSQTSIKRFGAWRKAFEAAGVPYRKSTAAKEKIYSDGELLDCLRDASQALGGELKFRAYDELAHDQCLPDGRRWPSHNALMNRFGSWANALEAAGLSHKPPGRQQTYSDGELLDCLRSASQELGELTVSAYGRLARDRRLPDGRPWPTESVPKKRFGTWRKALEAAGVS